MKQFDVIIIGVGQAGAPLAHAFAGNGDHVAVIERKHPGGSCVNYGCTPTKTMIASANAAQRARNSNDLGVNISSVAINFRHIIKRRDSIVEDSRKSLRESLINDENIEYIQGEASFSDTKEISITLNEGGVKKIKAERIFINTGTSPRIPEVPGIGDINYLTAKTMMNLQELPGHLLIIGGSYIGAELGQAYRRFGSKVSIFEATDQLIGREDEDIANELQEILMNEGIDVYLNASIKKIEDNNGKPGLQIEQGDQTKLIEGTHLLIAAGTSPNTTELNLDAAGIETAEHGHIKVNERLETNVEGIYALGDVKGGPEFTHISYDDFRIVHKNILHNANRSVNDRMIPYTMFTDPQLGRIGLNEKAARKEELNYKVAKMRMKETARGNQAGQTDGFMKVLVRPEDGKILGASMLMSEGGELMSVIQVAMMGGLPYTDLRDGVFAHPTYTESLNNLFTNLK